MVKKTNKKLFFSILISVILISLAVFVFAAVSGNFGMKVVSPATGTNWSGAVGTAVANTSRVFFNVTFLNITDITDPLNATVRINSTVANVAILGNLSTCVGNGTGAPGSCYGYLNITVYQNKTMVPDGVYQVNITLTNHSALAANPSVNSSNTSFIIIDTTAPRTVSVNGMPSGQNHSTKSNSGNFTLNVTADDALANISTVQFLILNATGDVNGTITGIKEGSSPQYSATVNTSHFPNGYVNITLFVNDTAGNYNVTAYSNSTPLVRDLIFDNALPSVSFSCTPTKVNSGDTVTCTCSGSATSGVNSTSYTASPSTSNTGTYTQTCEVISKSGVVGTATASYTIEQSGSGTSSSGGSTTTSTVPSVVGTVAVSEAKIASGYRATFSNNAQIQSSFQTSSGGIKEKHSVKVTNISSNKITLVVSSDPVTLDLSIGETKKIDLDSDKTYDLSLTLNGIVSGKADVSVKQISEAAPTGQEGSVSPGETPRVTDGAGEEESTTKTNLYLWIILVVAVVVIIVGIVWYSMKKK
ncbi:hypothetical protein COU56_03870 [Candidatus Pacearchaeota archaeon CG10_big_fil_rev_8_21_14_0_10_31_9]|nr:MAG: hypothetical protein COU56_03870 [Candidatus Pacearchaeota archaeon CG10_big_fil_rev_8_21_14_0_10_31_9]